MPPVNSKVKKNGGGGGAEYEVSQKDSSKYNSSIGILFLDIPNLLTHSRSI